MKEYWIYCDNYDKFSSFGYYIVREYNLFWYSKCIKSAGSEYKNCKSYLANYNSLLKDKRRLSRQLLFGRKLLYKSKNICFSKEN